MNVIVESEYAESMLRVFKYHPHFTMSDSDREGLLEKKKEDLVDYVLALRSDDTDLNKKLDRANNYIDMYIDIIIIGFIIFLLMIIGLNHIIYGIVFRLM